MKTTSSRVCFHYVTFASLAEGLDMKTSSKAKVVLAPMDAFRVEFLSSPLSLYVCLCFCCCSVFICSISLINILTKKKNYMRIINKFRSRLLLIIVIDMSDSKFILVKSSWFQLNSYFICFILDVV